MGDRPETASTAESAHCAHASRRGVKTSHLVLGAAAALLAIAALVGGLRAGDEVAGYQLAGWRGGWHHNGAGAEARICSVQRDAWLADRIEAIEAFVTFTPVQQPAWQELTRAIEQASGRVGTACARLEEAGRPATAPARLERAELMLATALDVVQELRPAIEAFYATLEPEQQAALDRLAARRSDP